VLIVNDLTGNTKSYKTVTCYGLQLHPAGLSNASYEKAAVRFSRCLGVLCLPAKSVCRRPRSLQGRYRGFRSAMILIPGLTCGSNVWDGTVAHFKDRYQCHVLTLAGFAGQPAIDGPFLEKARDGIVRYIHEQKLNHPVIIGHSLGGMMAFWVAETAPAEVGPIISVDGVPFFSALMDPTATHESTLPMAEQTRAMYAGLTADQHSVNNRQFFFHDDHRFSNVDKVASLSDKSDPKAVGQAF